MQLYCLIDCAIAGLLKNYYIIKLIDLIMNYTFNFFFFL